MEYLWGYYVDIKNAGDVNYQSLMAYSKLMAVNLSPRESSIIMGFERVYREASNG